MQKIQNPSMKPLPKSGIEEELVEQELFLHDIGKDAIYCFNSGAAVIWYLCDGTRDVESIAREIATGFELPEQQVLPEVRETVDHFQSLGLLEIQPPLPI